MKEPVVLVCSPADAPRAIPGSSYDRECSICGRRLMIAPSGQRLLKREADVRLVCQFCWTAVSGALGDLEIQTDNFEEIRAELPTAQPNPWRKRN